MQTLFVNSISILGLIGFLLALYIYRKKKGKKKLICPMRSNCDTVIHSDYSKILGIPVEVLGMIYYFFIGTIYSAVYLFGLWSLPVALVLLGVSGAAVVFSLYLVLLQLLIVRHWCIWCLSSALISVLIFTFSYLHMVW